MATEVILALVLAALFCGAIVWLAVYSRRRQPGAAQSEQQASPDAGKAGEVRAGRAGAAGRAARR